MKQKLLLLLLSLFLVIPGYSQRCSTPGQTPNTAFPVCGIKNFSQQTVPLCVNGVMPSACLDQNGQPGYDHDWNPFWYKFHCYQSGLLGFLITPNTITDDYDWELFDVTGHNPDDIYTDHSLFVCCSWSGRPGPTGASVSGYSNGFINCSGGGYPQLGRMPTIIAGHEYILLISHFTDSQSGYTLSFTVGSNLITDTLPPALKTISANCTATELIIQLSKKMKCSSMSTDGTEFTITPPAATIVSVSGNGCVNNGFDMDSVVLLLSNPLPSGNYTLMLSNGTDGNTLVDNCGTYIPAGNIVNFSVSIGQPSNLSSIKLGECKPRSVELFLTKPVRCNSIAADGSDFMIVGPSPVAVIAAITNCTNDITTGITLQFDSPLNDGNYQVQLVNGTDGNTIMDECDLQTATGLSVDFVIKNKCGIAVPSSFSPDGNGINDFLFPLNGSLADKLEFKIYNRWGKLVFHSNNSIQKWDGTLKGIAQPAGTYIWILDYTDHDSGKRSLLKGTTVLIR